MLGTQSDMAKTNKGQTEATAAAAFAATAATAAMAATAATPLAAAANGYVTGRSAVARI